MLIGHQPKEFLLAVEALTVSFDGFKAVNDLSFYVEENEIGSCYTHSFKRFFSVAGFQDLIA